MACSRVWKPATAWRRCAPGCATAGGTSIGASAACCPLPTLHNPELHRANDGQGRVTGAIGVASNITEREHAEKVLRASEERFRSVTESAHDAIILADSQGTIL